MYPISDVLESKYLFDGMSKILNKDIREEVDMKDEVYIREVNNRCA